MVLSIWLLTAKFTCKENRLVLRGYRISVVDSRIRNCSHGVESHCDVSLSRRFVNVCATENVHTTMHSKMPLCLLLIVLLGSVEGTYAQTIKPAPVSLAFEKKLPEWLKETNVPAAGIGIIENGKLTYTRVFGELRKGGPTPAPPNSIFQVASLTKPVVEILTLQLVTI